MALGIQAAVTVNLAGQVVVVQMKAALAHQVQQPNQDQLLADMVITAGLVIILPEVVVEVLVAQGRWATREG